MEQGQKTKKDERKEIMLLLDKYFRIMEETSNLVDPIILNYFEKSKGRICNNDEIYKKLYEAAIGRLGKPKMRSHIARLGYEICGGKDLINFLPIAASMDLLEFSYYCCDKIFDYPGYYQNRQNVQDKIIISHILISLAYDLIGESIEKLKLNEQQTHYILNTVSSFIKDIYEGFFIENHNNEPSMDVYERRTYAYNYWEHILKIGGIAAGGSNERINALSNFGENIGIAYMVTNDISDIIKDFEDIKNGRYTIINILFLEKASKNEKELFKKAFGNQKAQKNDLESIAKIMVEREIIKESQIYASKFIEKALPYLQLFDNSLEKKMLAVATRAVYRNQWYRSLNELYGYKRAVSACGLELAGINDLRI
ncbi:MAG: polyprenyl synthetase family protein [Candidatus Paceibacterota bacterium]|jgi:geranylgeranyl pyrophosphate synthase